MAIPSWTICAHINFVTSENIYTLFIRRYKICDSMPLLPSYCCPFQLPVNRDCKHSFGVCVPNNFVNASILMPLLFSDSLSFLFVSLLQCLNFKANRFSTIPTTQERKTHLLAHSNSNWIMFATSSEIGIKLNCPNAIRYYTWLTPLHRLFWLRQTGGKRDPLDNTREKKTTQSVSKIRERLLLCHRHKPFDLFSYKNTKIEKAIRF